MTKKKGALSGASIAEFYSKYGALLILALVFIVGSIFVPRFLSGDNILSIFNQVSIIAVLSCGMSFIIISGNADLQAGSAIALLSCICAVMMKAVGNPVAAFVVGIINNCMNLMGINAYYQQIVKGVVIVIAIIIDKKTRDSIMRS